jgi:hypothetical protein
MSNNIFPVVENGNELSSVDKDHSYFFEIVPPDIEMMDEEGLATFNYNNEHLLKNFDEMCFYKFYKIGRRSFLNTDSEQVESYNGIRFIPCESPLGIFFGAIDFYSDLNIFDDHLVYNGQYVRVLSVRSFSSDIVDYNLIPCDIDYVLNLKKKADVDSVKKLDRIRTSHLSSFLKPKRDIDSEKAYSEAEELLEQVKIGNESLYDVEMYFILKDVSLEKLCTKTFDVIKYFNLNGFELFIEGQSARKWKTGLFSFFRELIPGVKPKLFLRSHVDKLSHVVQLLPFKRSFLMRDGLDLFDVSDQEIFFDPFDSSIVNKNTLVSGMSGAGKSVFVNKIVHHYINEHPTVILDKGGSFRKLCLYHDGEVLNDGFNPMQFKDPVYLREIILSVVDKKRFSKLDRGKLLALIKDILENDIDTFWEVIIKLEDEFEGISYYFEDIKKYLTNEYLDNSSILYVDLDSYPKNIVSPLIIFLLEYFKNIKAKEKILVFDECWSFLKDHGDYIDECFRTFRKTGAFPIAISQSLSDFEASSELSSSIVNNSYFKVLFPQDVDKSTLLNEFDKGRIKELKYQKNVYSECYLRSSDNKYRKILRVRLSNTELELFNTEADSFERFYQYLDNNRQYFKTNKDTIDSYVRMIYA